MIRKMGIRWGRGQKRLSVKERKELQTIQSDLDDAYTRIARLEKQIEELASETGVYLPSFSSRYYK